jgi:LPLT family lysophospholipid transporter-like MFS transporter
MTGSATTTPTAPLLVPKYALAGVLVAQFLSALADNALLFAAIALLKTQMYPSWSIPVLQEFFVAAFILLAPFAGPLADGLPKGRVMLIANGMKLAGAAAMLAGLNPFIAYGLVGLGAAAYSPAKYGILSELVPTDRLVKANGAMEASTIAAILLGALAGGKAADWSVLGTLVGIVALYAAAGVANLFIPPTGAALRPIPGPREQLRVFGRSMRTLWADGPARMSMLGTSAFWGAGATLRFLLVAWVPAALAITSNAMPAYLNASTAVGIVVGAALASRFVTMENASRAIWAGLALGVVVALLAAIDTLPLAFALTALVGIAGGFFVVPLNALLQERGHALVGTGSAIAAQNLMENLLMMTMVGLYTGLNHAGVGPSASALVFGLGFSAACALLLRSARK